MSKNNKGEVLKINAKNGVCLQNFDANAAISREMNGLTAVFDVVKIPIGGMILFEMPTDNPEETENVKEFDAVILYHHPMRAYYDAPYTGGNNPPTCCSFDNISGVGTPGGDCVHCLYNEFGTGVNGAKACKERRRLYLLREGDIFPLIMSLPTGSLKPFSRYLLHCLPKWGASNAGMTRFKLVKDVNKGGIVFTKAQFEMVRPLTEEEFSLATVWANKLRNMSNDVPMSVHSEIAQPTPDVVAVA